MPFWQRGGMGKRARFDVVIVGAGISGIGAAWHLKAAHPARSFALLEARDAVGGTWDLFRYPGIRSDSDMFTLGYAFRPWTEAKAIADGPAILRYVNETVDAGDLRRHIRFRHRVKRLSFDSSSARWTLEVETPEGPALFEAGFVVMAAGYYSYDNPHNPVFPGEERFAGPLFHAQFWPRDLDYRDKRVVVVGSGATAVTLVPALAGLAAHVTMLQRSPTWMVSRPSTDRVANAIRRVLPPMLGYNLVRLRNVLLQRWVFARARSVPEKVNARVMAMLRKELPEEEIRANFTPRYNVWEQRLCLVPDSDFFRAMRAGRAAVVTDEIAEVTGRGLALKSGRHLEADIIVKATGLRLQMMGGAEVVVDGQPLSLHERFTWRGMMIEGVPNLVYVFGYFNASWTLRADLTAAWICRLLAEMDKKGAAIAVPEHDGPPRTVEPPFMSSGYIQRALGSLPRQATEEPWRDLQDYLADRKRILKGPLAGPELRFRTAAPAPARVREPA
ncbi:flavin-containing monooxygenase [Thermaurantiacus sp.]